MYQPPSMSSSGSEYRGATPLILSEPSAPASRRKHPRKRQATVYDAVAGRVSSTGFLPLHPFTSKNRDTLSSSSVAVPPEEVLFRRRGAPERSAEDDIYWASRHLREDQVLPDSDLLKAVHAYASQFYSRRGGAADFESLDGTALIAVGFLLEEWAGEVLRSGGDGVFVEGEWNGQRKIGGGEIGGFMGDRAWRVRRMAEKRREDKKKGRRKAAKQAEKERDEDEDEDEAIEGHTKNIPNGESRIDRTRPPGGGGNESSDQTHSDDERTSDLLDDRDTTTTTTNSDDSDSNSEFRTGIDLTQDDQDDDSTEEDSGEPEEHVNSTSTGTPQRNLKSRTSSSLISASLSSPFPSPSPSAHSPPSASASASTSSPAPEAKDEPEDEVDEEDAIPRHHIHTHKRRKLTYVSY